MLVAFEKYAGVKILEHFVLNPEKEVHIKGLAKDLNISASTSKEFCDKLLKEKILEEKKIANLRLFKLKKSTLTNEISRPFIYKIIKKEIIELNNKTIKIKGTIKNKSKLEKIINRKIISN